MRKKINKRYLSLFLSGALAVSLCPPQSVFGGSADKTEAASEQIERSLKTASPSVPDREEEEEPNVPEIPDETEKPTENEKPDENKNPDKNEKPEGSEDDNKAEEDKADEDTSNTPDNTETPGTSSGANGTLLPDSTLLPEETVNPEENVSEEAVKNVQKLIDALPAADEITEETLEDVSAQLSEIEDTMNELNDDERAKLKLARYHAAVSAVEKLNGAKLMQAAELAAPGNPKWDDTTTGKATWDAVEGAVGYKVQLYSWSGGPEGLTPSPKEYSVSASQTSYTFSISNIHLIYAFTVKAIGKDGTESQAVQSGQKMFQTANAKEFTVSFYGKEPPASVFETTKVEANKPVAELKNGPEREGYTLEGWWYKQDDNGNKILWDFKQPVTEDLDLFPAFKSNIEFPEKFDFDPTQPGSIRWSPVDGASGYIVQLYDTDLNKLGSSVPVAADTTTYNFKITDTSQPYVFGIKSVNQKGLAGPEAVAGPITYLSSPTNLQWSNNIVGKATWNAVNDKNVVGYYVQLYTASAPGGIGSAITEPIFIRGKNTTTYTFKIDNTISGYAFSVSAMPDDNAKNIGGSPKAFSQARGFDHVNTDSVFVKFDANGGGLQGHLPPAGINTRVGSRISAPSGVTRPGYRLVGWRYNPSKMWDFNDPVTTSMTLTAVWAKADASSNTRVTSVSVDGVRGSGSSSSGIFNVRLPKGSAYKDDPAVVSVKTSDSNASVRNLHTSNGGKTWYFTVVAEDGVTEKNYTVNVSISSSSSSSGSGGGGGGSSSGGGGGGAVSSGGSYVAGGPGASGSGPANTTDGTWKQDSTGWWVEKPDGSYPQDAWYEMTWKDNKNWYHFNPTGYLDSGWFTDKDGNTYFLHNTHDDRFGYMYTGWNWIGGKCYYFNPVSGQNGLPYGAMLKNTTTPDGYTVNEAGEWTVNGAVQVQEQQPAAQQTDTSAAQTQTETAAQTPTGDFEGFKNDFLQGLNTTSWNASVEQDTKGNVTINLWRKNDSLDMEGLKLLKWVKGGGYASSEATDLMNSWNRLKVTLGQLAQLSYQKFKAFGLTGTHTYNILTNDTKTAALTYQNGVQTFDYTD